MKTTNKKESGQILIILALALVGLLAFTALAIDGGMYLSDRRYAQNAADASALAGAGAAAMKLENMGVQYVNFNCGGVAEAMNSAITQAKLRSESNRFALDEDPSDGHGVEVTCHMDDMGSYVDKYLLVRVMVTTNTQTSFAQLFFKGPLRNTVEAITRVRPRNDLTWGYAISAYTPTCQGNDVGVEFDGSNEVLVHGGGIFSSACITTNGGVSVRVDPVTKGIRYMTNFTKNGSGAISPLPTSAGSPLPQPTVPVPNCGAVPKYNSAPSGSTATPGRYPSIDLKNNETLTLQPGLYCISNGVKITGGVFTGTGVTIYLTGGDFSTAGSATVNLSAPVSDAPPAIRGMLIYMARGQTGNVTLEGNGSSSYMGTVYVPDGTIDVGGSTSMLPTVNTQLIGGSVKVHGNTNVEINFNTTETYQRPATLELMK